MTALSVPVALAIALQCAPAEDPEMLVGIAQQESGLETMTLHDDASGQVLRGAGVIEMARRLIATGHSVDLGAWQINSRNLALLGLGDRRRVRSVQIGGGRSPVDPVVQPIQHRQPLAGYRERLRTRGYGLHPRMWRPPARPCRRRLANRQPPHQPVHSAVANRRAISCSQPKGNSRCPG